LMGQLSSAILEYESIIQRFPEDADAQKALLELESKAKSLGDSASPLPEAAEPGALPGRPALKRRGGRSAIPTDFDDGRDAMHKIFVEAKVIAAAHFEECWVRADY